MCAWGKIIVEAVTICCCLNCIIAMQMSLLSANETVNLMVDAVCGQGL